jgi:LacI family repressor for deo operon, udp, cdd, tsx, nupC, and nupG
MADRLNLKAAHPMAKNSLRAAGAGARAVTMADVASRAGVSTATVSRVLSEPDLVAPSTQKRVARIIEEIGYAPNLTARSLRVQSTKMVLALAPAMVSGFFAPILSAIEDEMATAGYGVIIGDTRDQKEREVHYARLIQSRQVDGVILMTGRLPRCSDGGSVDTTLPVVLVCNDVRGAGLPFVGVDNRKAASVMTEYLISMGHKKIAHITGPIDHVEDARERKRGFLDTMKSAGFEVPQYFVWEGNYYPTSGSEAAKRFLALSDRPTAVFAANDATALMFVRDLGLAGVSVPQDVSVVGFDDIENLAFFTPAITTMRQPRAELGRLAAQDLLRRMAGDFEESKSTRVRLDCEIVIRGSVRSYSA